MASIDDIQFEELYCKQKPKEIPFSDIFPDIISKYKFVFTEILEHYKSLLILNMEYKGEAMGRQFRDSFGSVKKRLYQCILYFAERIGLQTTEIKEFFHPYFPLFVTTSAPHNIENHTCTWMNQTRDHELFIYFELIDYDIEIYKSAVKNGMKYDASRISEAGYRIRWQ